jgi:alkylated DNA nucleotide flippase Atl1
MPKPRATWSEKLNDSKGLPKVKPIPDSMSKTWGTGTLVIPSPAEVDEFMRKVPRGKLTTINDLRAALARKHQATIGCPMTTGIFSGYAARAAEEQRQSGRADVTPYWRTLKAGGLLNEKYPGGAEAHAALLKAEGHIVVKKGSKYFVQDYQQALAQL